MSDVAAKLDLAKSPAKIENTIAKFNQLNNYTNLINGTKGIKWQNYKLPHIFLLL